MTATGFLKPDPDEALEQWRSFWRGDDPDAILIQINVREKPMPRDGFMRAVPDVHRMLEDHILYFEGRKGVRDATLPVITPNFGAGFEAGYFGAPVRYGYGTSYAQPIMESVSDHDAIDWSLDSDHARGFLDALGFFQDRSAGVAWSGLSPLLSPLDTTFALAGSGVFLEMCDRPGEVLRLLERLTAQIIAIEEMRLDALRDQRDGRFQSWMSWWAPGRTICVGDDQLCSCSAEQFRTFGLPYYQRLIDHFGSGWYHLHTLGSHLVPELASLRGLICLEVSDDPNTDIRGLDLLPVIRRAMPHVAVKVAIRTHEFIEGLDSGTLLGNVIYNICDRDYADIEGMTMERANALAARSASYRMRKRPT